MTFLKNWQRKRVLQRRMIPLETWRHTVAGLPLLAGLDAAALERLRGLASLFVDEKSLEPVQGLALTNPMRFHLAAQAALPILHLGLDWYDGWKSVVVHPAGFVTQQQWTDAAGVVHSRREARIGEAWDRGPVVLSWEDVAVSGQCDGYNCVIHEMAHKLDYSSGTMNGCPALHDGMTAKQWRAAFEPAFADMQRRSARGEPTAIDPYAAESPQEFFAVASEAFFEIPHLLQNAYPAVYEQLRLFYRQDPAQRLTWQPSADGISPSAGLWFPGNPG